MRVHYLGFLTEKPGEAGAGRVEFGAFGSPKWSRSEGPSEALPTHPLKPGDCVFSYPEHVGDGPASSLWQQAREDKRT